MFASIGPKPSFKFLVILIYLLALKTREGIFFLKKSSKAENFSVFKEEKKQESQCDIMKHTVLAAPGSLWISCFTQICNLPTLSYRRVFPLFGTSHCFKLRSQKPMISSRLTVNTVECHIHTAGVLYWLLIAVMF